MHDTGETIAMDSRFIIWLSTNAAVTWLIRHGASRIDPLIFKATNGRFTSMGVPSMPMLTMTAVIQLLVYPDAWLNAHMFWATILFAVVALGPGKISLDHLITRRP